VVPLVGLEYPRQDSNLQPSGPQPESSSASTSLQYAAKGGILPSAAQLRRQLPWPLTAGAPFALRLNESSVPTLEPGVSPAAKSMRPLADLHRPRTMPSTRQVRGDVQRGSADPPPPSQSHLAHKAGRILSQSRESALRQIQRNLYHLRVAHFVLSKHLLAAAALSSRGSHHRHHLRSGLSAGVAQSPYYALAPDSANCLGLISAHRQTPRPRSRPRSSRVRLENVRQDTPRPESCVGPDGDGYVTVIEHVSPAQISARQRSNHSPTSPPASSTR
jgi:hypothetical protein